MSGSYGPLFRRVIYPAYETVLRRRGTLAYAAEYEANSWLSTDEIAHLQWRKLERLVAHCWEHVPYYRARWTKSGIEDPRDIRNVDDYARLPILTKQDVRDNFEQLKSSRHRGRLLYKTTGGSTGEPLTIGYTRESYERRTAVMFRGYGWANAKLGRRALYLWGVASQGFKERLHHALFNRRMLDIYNMSDANMHEYVREIDRRRPEIIVSYVASIVRLSQWLLKNGVRVHAPQAVLCAAEPLYEYQRKLIEQAFGCQVYNTYGCREFMLIASECEQRDGLHVNADHLRVELGDHIFASTERGIPRQVLVTDLHNYGAPLLRYANGDMASERKGACACGRGLPLLDKIEGRSMDALRTPQGHYVGELLEHLMFDTPGIARFQAVQSRVDVIDISIVRQAHFRESSLECIRASMHDAYGDGVRLNFHYADEIPLTPTGKLRVAISTLCASATAVMTQLTLSWERMSLDPVMVALA
ncbi:MAG: phenylacetate--CoA ligase family protein [Pseudoxanthomonas sp.]